MRRGWRRGTLFGHEEGRPVVYRFGERGMVIEDGRLWNAFTCGPGVRTARISAGWKTAKLSMIAVEQCLKVAMANRLMERP